MRNRTKKSTAWFFLIIFGIETFYPSLSFALTSGPSQPELTKFEPAGVNDLVDLFTGDFKYNIPLVDVGGYPINLSYGSGEGMEDEASWVGFGWTLNPGTINRDMRGLPDDFTGKLYDGTDKADEITKTYKRKEFQKIGGNIVLKPSALAWEISAMKGNLSFNLGVYKDNYYGTGASIGFSLSQQLAKNKKTSLTAGLDFNSDNREGATFSPSLNLSRANDWWEDENLRSVSGSLAYNTRAGLKSVELGASFSTAKKNSFGSFADFKLSAVKYFGQTYTPTFNTNTKNRGYTLSFDLGPSIFGGYIGIGGAGYYYYEEIAQKSVKTPAYGYMNYVDGRKSTSSLVDFNREKDGVYVPGTPAIPVPVPTNDFFTATGQAGSLQFRPYFNGDYVVFDKAYSNNSSNDKAGVTIGIGNVHKSGGRVDVSGGSATTGKWVSNNDFLNKAEAEFGTYATDDAVTFKQTGELTRANNGYLDKIKNEKTVQVVINDKQHFFSKARTWESFKSRSGMEPVTASLKKDVRDKRTNVISFLNARQASQFGLDKKINGVDRVAGGRKAHHLSEITVTDNGGKRMVYGIPVYNNSQSDVSFSIDKPIDKAANGNDPADPALTRALKTGLVKYTPGTENSVTNNKKGRDQLYSKDEIPPYATSFLLTGILSPDYVDVGNDGITDDDLGTAYKFNYQKVQDDFRWRAPYARGYANYSQGFASDPKDDKANYAYGSKELWYLDNVESKTMIAFFTTSDREDGLGVLDEDGGKDANKKIKKLDKITLYSKAEWLKNGANAVPIKVVHFEYDYSTHPGVPNNTGNVVNNTAGVNINAAKGKLTLKRIYFTFGNNNRGQSNPYDFSYEQRTVADVFGTTFPAPPVGSPQDPVPPFSNTNPEVTNSYATHQSDRWGTYKPSWYNQMPGSTNGVLNNSEYPYALQEDGDANKRKLAGLFASMWQLNKIVTPTGSTISVEYEADDYGYVQNRKAMQMYKVNCLGDNPGGSNPGRGMMGAPGFTVELPVPVADIAEFKRDYLTGADGQPINNLYYKIYTDIDNRSHYEYVTGYAEIEPTNCKIVGNSNTTVFIPFKTVGGYNPVTKAAWQMLKTDLPQFAYDNYDNSDVSFTAGAIKSLIQAVVNMKEYVQSFEKMAYNRNYADNIDVSKSMIRLCSRGQGKIGGGARVRRLTIEDDWYDMSHTKGKTARYGELYEYVTKDTKGQSVSTGVAAYEPQIGNEENPFHEPIPYTEKVHWAPDKYHFVERPFCESFFPAATVGYSKVTVTSFGDDEAQSNNLAKYTGYSENEFYTAKDFPTIVDNMPLESTQYEDGLIVKLFTSTTIKRVATSQGFKVELNDMHGKPKSVKIFDKGGAEISSTETFYNVDDDNAVEKHLNNLVDVVSKGDNGNGGSIETALLGTDVDLATDVRESKNESEGGSLGIYTGGMVIPFFIPIYLPYFAVNPGYNIMRDSYHSVSTVKVIHKYGIVKKTVTRQNGSTAESENILWDGETGGALLTKTQNEFNDYIYTFNYPAYWAEGHEGMGAAYENIGAVLAYMSTNSDGIIPDPYNQYTFPGDELINTGNGQKSWVMRVGNDLRLIDAAGNLVSGGGTYIVYRSGKRNLQGASAGSIVCLKNPIAGTGNNRRLQFNVGNKILDAKAVLYSNEWSMPVGNTIGTVPGYKPPTSPAEYSDIYTIDELNNSQCSNAPFEATSRGRGSVVKRAFLNFSDIANGIPANATIVSARLTLYPWVGTSRGANDAYLRRVIEVTNCFSGRTLSNSPAVTSANQLLISGISNASGPLYYDVTGMFNDWFTTRDVAVFGVSLQLISESGSILSTPKIVSFHGNDQFNTPPALEVQYMANGCVSPVGRTLNPYVQGILGNWRPKQNFMYMVDREQKPGSSSQLGGTDIRNNGAYTIFNPFWEITANGKLHTNVQVEPVAPAERWVWASKSIYYDQKGNVIESAAPVNRTPQGEIDVTGGYRYSSALYGYGESSATAVAVNARHNEIAFDGFEDYYFTLRNGAPGVCGPLPRHFDWGLTLQNGAWKIGGETQIVTSKVHSGRYSLQVQGDIDVSKPLGNPAPPTSILGYTGNGQAFLGSNELANGFTPVGSGKQYLLSMWVYDNAGTRNSIDGLSLTINSTNVDMTKPVPVVEGWKQLVVPFTAATGFNLHMHATNAFIDDVRIFPYEGNMTSFVYDDRNMRLMAQLDENNFATFYEYDDEGTPIRVKKETERGIMTLKENRQSFKKRP